MNNRNQDSKPKSSPYLRLTSAGLQMGGVITALTYFGFYLDNRYHLTTPWWTIILGLTGVAIGLFIVIREVMEISKKKR